MRISDWSSDVCSSDRGLGFGGWVWWYMGATAGMQYVTGFVIEKSLARDNVFVIAMIFAYFAVPRLYPHRVLFYGILDVIILPALMIGIGATLVGLVSWVLYGFEHGRATWREKVG